MALPSRAILLLCVFGYVNAQYTEVDILPQRTATTSKHRYQRLQNPRPGNNGPQLQTISGTSRPSRPTALSRPRPSPASDGPEYPSLSNARPRPIFISPLAVKTAHIPTAAQERQQLKQEQQQQQQQQQQPQEKQQQQSVIKPVSEDAEDEEDVAHAIANLGAVSSFPQQSGNLVAGPLTPKPDLGFVQYRGGSPSSAPLARPAPLNEQNIAPIQYRPQKPFKLRKPIIDEVPEVRVTARQQQQPKHHQQQAQQPSVRTSPKVSDTREKYTESRDNYSETTREKYTDTRDKYSEPREKYSEPREKYAGSREKKPVAQIIRRWREDNPDGSITWGFENDDGSYKEELIGIDCITRGKYGYIDLDGIRREYTYETGIKCDEEQQEEDRENGFVDYQENKLVLPNGKTIDLSSMGKKQARRPQPVYRN